MPPTFSIIIPAYNVAPYLAECLDSIRAQTYADWEALCVDDGSTDTSSTLLDTYARLDPRIHVTHQRNAGVSSARNRALDTACGDWVLFLDSDDVFVHKDVLAWYQEQVANAEGDRIVFGEVRRFDDGSIWQEKGAEALQVELEDLRKGMSSRALFDGFWGGCYPRMLAAKALFPMLSFGEDQVFLARVLELVDWVVFLNRTCYGYRVRSGSVTQQKVLPLKQFTEVIALQYEWLEMAKRAVGQGKRWTAACYKRLMEWFFVHLVHIYQTVNPSEQRQARAIYSRLLFAFAGLRSRDCAMCWRLLAYSGGVIRSPLSASSLYRGFIFSTKVRERIQRCLKKLRQRMRW